MKPNTTGRAKPDLVEEAGTLAKEKTRTYINPADGTKFKITEEEFAQVVKIFEYLRNSRNAQVDTLEPETDTQEVSNDLKEKAG
ncbi:MAG: hypothetical protein COT74_01685 [Bdellovibrionales bacterium CG10_big_fil_rev_8_21_14_0_10_45_34]|nr:MAG: hypothetical protein COT74_01685 [Bdellovibrionales bacterium CG10_big_fil_rev_8_21_14_0_10_45_34]